jgi:hypothetical protein
MSMGPVGVAALVAQAVVFSEYGGGYMDECRTVAVLKLDAKGISSGPTQTDTAGPFLFDRTKRPKNSAQRADPNVSVGEDTPIRGPNLGQRWVCADTREPGTRPPLVHLSSTRADTSSPT